MQEKMMRGGSKMNLINLEWQVFTSLEEDWCTECKKDVATHIVQFEMPDGLTAGYPVCEKCGNNILTWAGMVKQRWENFAEEFSLDPPKRSISESQLFTLYKERLHKLHHLAKTNNTVNL